ncbi:hypothetical protein NPIL_326361, partial [Nephila pilipes]
NARQDNNGIKIFFTFDSPEDDGYCKDRFRSCPFNSMQIIKRLMSMKGIRSHSLPSLASPNNLDATKIHILT